MTRPCLSAALSSALLLHPDAAHETSHGPPGVRIARLTVLWREGNPGIDAGRFGQPWLRAESGMPARAATAPAAPLTRSALDEAPPAVPWAGDRCLLWLARGDPGAEDLVAMEGTRCPRPAGSASAAVAPGPRGLDANPSPPVEIVIGSRLRFVEGSATIIHATRVDALPGPLRQQAWAMIRQPMSRGMAMFHGSFVLPGIAFDDVRSVIALGPGLVKEHGDGRDGGILRSPRVEQAEVGRLLLGFGPFSFNIPSRLRVGAAGAAPGGQTRVDVTRSRWPFDSSTAVTVAGYLRDDTVITFRVSRVGAGRRRDEVLTFPSLHLGSLGDPGTEASRAAILETAVAAPK